MKPLLVSEKDLAAIAEVTDRTVRTWIREGLPILKRRTGAKGAHQIDLVAAFRWLRARDEAMHQEALEALRSTPELDELRRRKLAAEAETAEVNLHKLKGDLLEAAEIEPRWGRMVLAMRERILAIPPVAVQRGVVAPENESVIEELCHDALAELAANGDATEGKE